MLLAVDRCTDDWRSDDIIKNKKTKKENNYKI